MQNDNHICKPISYSLIFNPISIFFESYFLYYSSEKYNGESIGQSFLFNNKFLDGKSVADLWYSQKKNYDFINPSTKNIPLIKGFTNLVWKKTKKIGCGYACKEKDEKCYYCCTYYPGGIESIYMDNVLPIQELSEN